MRIRICLIALLVVGCSSEGSYTIREVDCPIESVDKISGFAQQCIKDGNPLSDEEPEDWIGKCLDMAQEIYCERVVVRIDHIKHWTGSSTEVGRTPVYKTNGEALE